MDGVYGASLISL